MQVKMIFTCMHKQLKYVKYVKINKETVCIDNLN